MLPPLSTLSWPLSVTVALPSPAVSLLTPETQHIHPGVLALSTGAGRPLAPRSGLRKVYTQGPLEDESRAVSAAASFLSFCSWQVPGLCMHDCLHSLDLSYWFGDPCAPWAKGRQLLEQLLSTPSVGGPLGDRGSPTPSVLSHMFCLTCFLLLFFATSDFLAHLNLQPQ